LPVRPVAVGDARYLVALFGETNWARNLRASPTATLVERRVEREIRAVEVFGEERDEIACITDGDRTHRHRAGSPGAAAHGHVGRAAPADAA